MAVERIKLFSTRSPWWCTFLAMGLTIGMATALATQLDEPMPVSLTQVAYRLGLVVMMVLAALSITTEYRFGTIRATFQAAPNRTAVLVAKTAVLAVVALVVGEICAFGSLGASALVAAEPDLALDSAQAWQQVAGVGLVFMFGAILALGVGLLLRQSAGALALILVWALLGERLLTMIPNIGDALKDFMPLTAAELFLQGSESSNFTPDAMFSSWGALAYFGAVSVGVWIVALVVAHRRDA